MTNLNPKFIMNKKLFSLVLMGTFFSYSYGQVGINTETPYTTLDAVRSSDNTKPDGIQAPRVTYTELEAKNNVYTTNQTGAIVYVTVGPQSTVTPTGKVINVKSVGYYYFDGEIWQNLAKEPWNVSSTTNQASSNTQDIYQMGRVGVGIASGLSASLHVLKNNPEDTQANAIFALNHETKHPRISLNRARFDDNLRTAVKENDILGDIEFQGLSSGSEGFQSYSKIRSVVDRPITSSVSSNLEFWTGNASTSKKVTIKSSPDTNASALVLNQYASASGNETSFLGLTSSGEIIKKPLSSIASIAGPWYASSTHTHATSNEEDIYQWAKVGIRITTPSAVLDVNGIGPTVQSPNTHTPPLRLRNIEGTSSSMLSTSKKNTLRPVYIDEDGVLVKLHNPVTLSSTGQNQSWYFDHNGLDLISGGSDIIAPGMEKQPSTIGNGTIVKFSFMTNFTFGENGNGLMYGTILFSRKNGFQVSEWVLSGSGATTAPTNTQSGSNWTLKLFSPSDAVLQFDYIQSSNKITVKKVRNNGTNWTSGEGTINIFEGMKMR